MVLLTGPGNCIPLDGRQANRLERLLWLEDPLQVVEVEGKRLERVGLDLPVRKIALGQIADRQAGLMPRLAGQLPAPSMKALRSAPGGIWSVPCSRR